MLLGLRHWQLCSGYIHECKHCHMLRSTSIVCSCLNEGESLVKVPIHVHTFHPIVTSMSLVSGLLSSQWLYWLCYTESNFVFCIANYGINTEMSWLPVYVPLDPKHLFSHWINMSRKACGIHWTCPETCMMIVSFPYQLKGSGNETCTIRDTFSQSFRTPCSVLQLLMVSTTTDDKCVATC